MGCVLIGGMGQAPTRQAAVAAGLSYATTCTTINKVCGSSLKAVAIAAQAIATGQARIVVAGGMESPSTTPRIHRASETAPSDAVVHDGLWDVYEDLHMGDLADLLARESGISREAQDDYAARSYARACAAQADGRLRREIVPVDCGPAGSIVVDDEEPGRNLSRMRTLSPAFDLDGTVTVANASKLADGAAALVLMSADEAERRGLRPLARIAGFAEAGLAPRWFTLAPVPAIERACARAGKRVGELSRLEINEAFAVSTLEVARRLGVDLDYVNSAGGAISLGHPLGATGARLLLAVSEALRADGGGWGVASACVGSGEGIAIVVEVPR